MLYRVKQVIFLDYTEDGGGGHTSPKCMYLYTKLQGIIFRKNETLNGTMQESRCIFCWWYIIFPLLLFRIYRPGYVFW